MNMRYIIINIIRIILRWEPHYIYNFLLNSILIIGVNPTMSCNSTRNSFNRSTYISYSFLFFALHTKVALYTKVQVIHFYNLYLSDFINLNVRVITLQHVHRPLCLLETLFIVSYIFYDRFSHTLIIFSLIVILVSLLLLFFWVIIPPF